MKSDRDLRLPPERFFWALLNVPPQARRRRMAREQLGYLFEAVLPIPIDDVQADYVRMAADGSRYLACGMLRKSLGEMRANAITLGPASIPAFLGVDVDPAKINLLIGTFEPEAVKRVRARWLVQAAAIAFILLTLLAVGHQRRIHDLRARAAALHEARHAVYTQVLGREAVDRARSGVGQPPELMLLAELRQLRQTRPRQVVTRGAQPNHTADATALLTALLLQWPVRGDGTNALHAQVESISITSSAITIQASLPSAEHVPALAEALRPPEAPPTAPPPPEAGDPSNPSHLPQEALWGGWRGLGGVGGWLLQQPQVIAQPSGVRATLRLTSRTETRR